MKALGKIRKQIEKTQDIANIITTMKNISIVNISHYERRVKVIRDYLSTVEKGFQILLQNTPKNFIKNLEEQNEERNKKNLGVVVLGSEKGLCGEFNKKLVEFFQNDISWREEVHVIAVGHKISTLIERRDIRTYDFPSSHEEISAFLRELLQIIENWLEKEKIGEVGFYYNQFALNLQYKPKFESIFPLNTKHLKSLKEKKWASHSLPTYPMETEQLFYELTQEMLFASMYRAFIESLASENSGRLISMQVAENNIEDRLGELQSTYQRRRQTEITEELFDIVSAFEALSF